MSLIETLRAIDVPGRCIARLPPDEYQEALMAYFSQIRFIPEGEEPHLITRGGLVMFEMKKRYGEGES